MNNFSENPHSVPQFDPYKNNPANNPNNFPPPPPYCTAPPQQQQQQQYHYDGASTGQSLPYPAQPVVAGFPTAQSLPTNNKPQQDYAPTMIQPGYFVAPPPPTATVMVYPGSQPTNEPLYNEDGSVASSQQILEDPNWKGFSDKAIRNAFIRKVYAILMAQLAFTVGIVALFIFHKGVKEYVRHNFIIYLAAYFTFLGVYIALACCKNLRRKYPTNLILLAIFTVSLTYLVATISSFHDTQIVIMALGICTACCLMISIFSCFTKFDFTSCGGVLFMMFWVLFLFGILCAFSRTPIMNTVYAGCGALIFMLSLAYNTQMLVGGKKYQISAEEHIFAALQLYLDIVYIFLFIMALLGGGRK